MSEGENTPKPVPALTSGLAFGLAADLYDSIRPNYPEDAINWLLPAGASNVLDLGAGTGKLSGQLAARGLLVTAVDPSEPMLSQLQLGYPTVSTAVGSGGDIPLPDGSFDACLMAQAWHWVEPVAASLEIGRVLRPGGRLGLIWNTMDESVGWVADFLGIINDHDLAQTDASRNRRIADPRIGPPFAEPEYFETRWTATLTPEDLVTLAGTRSYILTMPGAGRAELLTLVRDHATQAAAIDGTLRLRYITKCWRATR